MIDWHCIDTVLLDMDGTLLDLNYDNTLWNRVVPDRYCDARPSATERTRQELLQHMMDQAPYPRVLLPGLLGALYGP